MLFSDRLKQLRREFKITQDELAKVINKNRSTVAGYESEGKEPDFATINKLASYFNVSVDYLLGRTDIKDPVDEISDALKDNPELAQFWNDLKEREDLQLFFKQTKKLSPKTIRQVMKIIKAIEDEESATM